MRAHRRAQLAERMTAEPGWKDGGFVWCQPNGRPIGAHADWDEWKALLEAARNRSVQAHDARHTAALPEHQPHPLSASSRDQAGTRCQASTETV